MNPKPSVKTYRHSTVKSRVIPFFLSSFNHLDMLSFAKKIAEEEEEEEIANIFNALCEQKMNTIKEAICLADWYIFLYIEMNINTH